MLPQPAFVTRVNERRAPGYSGREQSGDIVEFFSSPQLDAVGFQFLPSAKMQNAYVDETSSPALLSRHQEVANGRQFDFWVSYPLYVKSV